MPIRWRLTFWFALILCAILGLSGVIHYVLLQRNLTSQLDDTLNVYSARVHGTVAVQETQEPFNYDIIHSKLPPAEVIANPVSVGDTIAGAIADDILFDAYTALPAIRQTGGTALSVTDEEMLEAEKLLAQTSGIFAEPSSASTIAALKKLLESNTIGSGQSVCCIITGSGFKDMASAKKLVGAARLIEPTIEAFLELD